MLIFNRGFEFAMGLLYLVIMPAVFAQNISDRQLAVDLTNPLAKIITVPFTFSYTPNINPNNTGNALAMVVQPLIPIRINPGWYVISRTVLPVIRKTNIFPASGSQFGLGDTLQNFFLAPNKKSGELLWGVGPTILIPTNTGQLLGASRWALGPGGVLIKITGPWTVEVLVNHIWSGKGGGSPHSLSFTRALSKVAYATKNAWSLKLEVDPTYDWEASLKVVPITFSLNKVLRIGKQPIGMGASIQYFIPTYSEGPKGFGAGVNITLLFPNCVGWGKKDREC